MSSPPRSGKVWTLVVVTAAIAGLLGIGFQLNSPDITNEDYWMIGIDRVPESRFLHVGGTARWEEVPEEYAYVIWLNGRLVWSNRFFEANPPLPKVWLEDNNRERVGRVYVKRTGASGTRHSPGMLGIGVSREDLKSAADGYIVVARNKREIARFPLSYSVTMVDFPKRPFVPISSGSVMFKCVVRDNWADVQVFSPSLAAEPARDDEGDLLVIVGTASFIPTGDEHANEIRVVLIPGQHRKSIELAIRPMVKEPMAIKVAGRVVHGTWVRSKFHVNASMVTKSSAGYEEELVVPSQTHSFVGGKITLGGTSIRKLPNTYVRSVPEGDHQIAFSLELSPSFNNDLVGFGGASEQTLVLISPNVAFDASFSPSTYAVPGESVLRLFNVGGLMEYCSHSADGFDIDIYTVTPTEYSEFSVKLKPSF